MMKPINHRQGNEEASKKSAANVFKIARALGSIYFSVSIPFRIAFMPTFTINIHEHASFVILDLIFNVILLIDMFQTVHRHSLYTKRKKQILPSSNEDEYISSGNSEEPTYDDEEENIAIHPSLHLILSFLVCVPLEYFSLLIIRRHHPQGEGANNLVNYLMINKIAVILHLPSCVKDISDFFEAHGLKSMGVQRAWKLLFAMAICGHWCCCGFFVVGKVGAKTSNSDLTSWPEEIGILQVELSTEGSGSITVKLVDGVSNAYIQSLYWAYITMITTGFGDITPLTIPETVWCLFSMCIGVIITTCSVANLQLLFTNADAAFSEYQQKMETIAKYMKYRKLPNELQDRIMVFYRYQWGLLRGADEAKILEELPSSIQQQVSNFLCRDLIAALPLLRKANVSLLNALAECAEINIYSPKDEILKRGDLIQGAILVSRGEVEVLSGSIVERKMKRLDNFGAENLFEKNKSTKTLRARTFCEIFLLRSEVFRKIVHSQCDEEMVKKMQDMAGLIQKNASKVNKLFGSAIDNIPTAGFLRHFVPNSSFRYSWDFLILSSSIFYLFSIPLDVMHYFDGAYFRTHRMSFITSYLCDFFFLLDTLLKFNFFMYYEEGLLIFDHESIRERFLRDHNMVRECAAMVPLDLLGIIHSRWCFLLRASKVFRLPQVIRSFTKLERALSDFKLEKGLLLLKIGKLNLALVVSCHWIGCLWHACATISDSIGMENNWVKQDEEDPSLSIVHSEFYGFGSYLRSVYWAIVGMTTVGYGDIVPTNILETSFATVIILFGGLILPAIVGGLAAYLSNVDLTTGMHQKKMLHIKKYMRQRSLGDDLIEKVVNYYDYLWSRQGALDEEAILNELPPSLRQEVSVHINRWIIDSVPFFYDCENSFKNLISLSLRIRVYMPLENIINMGEIGSSLCLMEKGNAVVIGDDGCIHFILGSGSYFGEGALLSARVASSTVKALTFCDIFELAREDFEEIVNATITQPAQERLEMQISVSLNKSRTINKNIIKNLRDYPKTASIVSRDFSCAAGMKVVQSRIGRINTSVSKQQLLVLNPDSTICFLWNVLVLLSILYNLWMVPYQLSFNFKSRLINWLFWSSDCVLMGDMYLSCFRIGFHRDGELVMDTFQVKSNYMTKRFKIDVISIIPYDVLYIILAQNGYYDIMIASLLRMPKLCWLARLPSVLRSIFQFLEDTDMLLAPLRLVEFFSGIILIAHWAACGFYILARVNSDSNSRCDYSSQEHSPLKISSCIWNGSWISRQIQNMKLPINGGTSLQQYLRALNWALPTLVTVVIGDVVPVNMIETLYAFIWIVVGVSINAAIIGNVANIVTNVDSDGLSFVKKTDEMKKYVKNCKVSPGLLNRVDNYISDLWAHNADISGDSFLAELPKTLQIQVTERTRYWHISHCPYFDFCSTEIIKALSLHLKLMLYSSDDIIVSFGDIGFEMFFLETGTVEIMSEDNKTVFATLTAENGIEQSQRSSVFFGETSLFFKKKRSGTVRAVTFCEVYRLLKKDLDAELGIGLGRDFDLGRMLNMFTSIAESNQRRNNAITRNLEMCHKNGSKLSKLVDPNEGVRCSKQIPAWFKPASPFRISCDVISILILLFMAIEIPFRVSFLYQTNEEVVEVNLPSWIFADFIVEIFFVVELYLRIYHFPIMHNGIIVVDAEDIMNEYMKNGLIIDALASVPVILISFVMNVEHNHLLYARAWHLVRLPRLPVYMTRIEGYLNLITNLRISAATRLLYRVFLYYFLVVHIYGCIWFCIHRYQHSEQFTWATTDCPNGNDFATQGCLSVWVQEENRHDVCHNDLWVRCYIRAVYFVFTTMSSVGYGDISPVTSIETLFQLFVVLSGASFGAGIIGSFTEFLSNSDESGHSAFKTKLKKLQEYMDYRQLPSLLQNEIRVYHHTRWAQSQVLDERLAVSMLSEPLQMEVAYEKMYYVIQKIPVLREISSVLLKRICNALHLQTSPKNCVIYQAGDIGWDIYFIGSGLVKVKLPKDLSVLDEEGRAYVAVTNNKANSVGLIYRPGNHFGESCLESTSGVRRETIVAMTVVQLHILSKEHLEEILTYTPQQERDRLKKNLLSRNGNVWHLFENENTPPILNSSSPSAARPSTLVRKTSPLMSRRTKYQHLSLLNTSSSSSKQQVTVTSRKLTQRLRSFSAEASTQALQIIQESHAGSIHTNGGFEAPQKGLDPVQAAQLVCARHVTISMGDDKNMNKRTL